MTRKKTAPRVSSPTLTLAITEADHARAVRSNSGGCLIADAISAQYPNLSAVSVDMATIRATDRQLGVRYVYLTPSAAQHLLLAFDQGWPQPVKEVVVRRAVQITPVVSPKTGSRAPKNVRARQAARVAELEAKEAGGEPLTRLEKSHLTRDRQALANPLPERPTTTGPAAVATHQGGGVVVVGGPRLPTGKPHPNLLRGRNRHFGAKLADPGLAFQEAVDAAVADRLNGPAEPALPLD